MTIREDFEKWAAGIGLDCLRLEGEDEYLIVETRYAWFGWQAATAQREAVMRQLATALKRICKSIPTDTDMTEAGWDGSEIEEACNAYDAARAAIQAYDEASK